MTKLTKEQIDSKVRRYNQLANEAAKLHEELVEAGAWPIDDDELDKVSGGIRSPREFHIPEGIGDSVFV